MATKYRYKLGESHIETLVLSEVPDGLEYETIEFEINVAIKVVPAEVSLASFRAILKITGKEQLIENALEQLTEPKKTIAKSYWNFGTVIERQSETVLYLQSILGMTDEEVDQIFTESFNIKI